MRLLVVDANGQKQTVLSGGLEAVVDHSAAILVTGNSQIAIAANPLRSGYVLQNVSNKDMWINEVATATVDSGSFKFVAGSFFPPQGFPITTGDINIVGTAGDHFVAREW